MICKQNHRGELNEIHFYKSSQWDLSVFENLLFAAMNLNGSDKEHIPMPPDEGYMLSHATFYC